MKAQAEPEVETKGNDPEGEWDWGGPWKHHRPHPHRFIGGFYFGAFLIVIGVVFLLQNLGIITEDVWGIIWPAVLILFGLSLLIPFRRW